MQPFAIVGYQYNADLYCPRHIIDALPTGEGEPFDGWKLAPGVTMTTEANLDEIAQAFRIDRYDEATFDSGHFPKVVFADEVTWRDQCCICGTYLDGEDGPQALIDAATRLGEEYANTHGPRESGPLSGEWADDWTPRDLAEQLGIDPYDDADTLDMCCDAFEHAYYETLTDED